MSLPIRYRFQHQVKVNKIRILNITWKSWVVIFKALLNVIVIKAAFKVMSRVSIAYKIKEIRFIK